MTDKFRYGIIGAGAMGREHIRNVNIIDHAEIVALADPHADSIQQSLTLLNNEVKTFKNHREMLDADLVDGYIISSPNYTHIDVLKDVILSKKNLLIEKPMCTSTKDCINFKNLTTNYPATIWTAMEYRYMPPVRRMVEEIHKNTIGNLKMLSIREHRFPFLVKVNDWNRFAINTGGTLVEKCCHFFDLMRLIVKSEAIQVYASGNQDVNHLDESYNNKKPDILDNAFVIVDFENGVRAMLDLCMFAENSNNQEELCAIGDKGKIETAVPSARSGKNASELRIGFRKDNRTHNETVEVDEKILKVGNHHGSTYYEHLSFLEAIKNNTPPEVSLEGGLRAVAIGEAAEISIKENRVVMMNDFNL
jgi:predicted dehydrogenase